MTPTCPRCSTANPDAARYCRQCGLALTAGPGGFLGAGRVGHSDPLEAPAGFQPLADAPDLFFQCESAWGGAVLLGTETLALKAFNAGYPLADVKLRVRGEDAGGGTVFAVEREIARWRRGKMITLEIASWELPAPAAKLVLALVTAEFGPDAE